VSHSARGGVFCLCYYIFMNIFSKNFFKEFLFSAVLVAALHFLAVQKDLYWSINEFDSLMHFLGGAMVGLFFVFFFYSSGLFQPADRTLFGFLGMALLGIAFVGVAWEIFEILTGTMFVSSQDYASDTTVDFIMDTLGSIAAALYCFARVVSSERKVEQHG
jgi:hypothetical protein